MPTKPTAKKNKVQNKGLLVHSKSKRKNDDNKEMQSNKLSKKIDPNNTDACGASQSNVSGDDFSQSSSQSLSQSSKEIKFNFIYICVIILINSD